MKLPKTKIAVVLTAIGLLGLPLITGYVALGQTSGDYFNDLIIGPQSVSGIVWLLAYIVRWIYVIFFIIAVLFILFAAFTYLGAGGDPGKVESAKTKLVYAIVAIVVALLSVGLEAIIRNFLIAPAA